jgi:hypothetical protein
MDDGVLPPRPKALRLLGSAVGDRVPEPPFGLREWSSDPAAPLAVVLDVPGESRGEELGGVDALSRQLPSPESVGGGALVIVLAEPKSQKGPLWHLFRRKTRIARAVRCTALLARGYVRIGAGVDPGTGRDLAWGYAPEP